MSVLDIDGAESLGKGRVFGNGLEDSSGPRALEELAVLGRAGAHRSMLNPHSGYPVSREASHHPSGDCAFSFTVLRFPSAMKPATL